MLDSEFQTYIVSLDCAKSLKYWTNFDSCLIFLDLKKIMVICNFPFTHFLKSLYIILK